MMRRISAYLLLAVLVTAGLMGVTKPTKAQLIPLEFEVRRSLPLWTIMNIESDGISK
jgi:hypothetical protein